MTNKNFNSNSKDYPPTDNLEEIEHKPFENKPHATPDKREETVFIHLLAPKKGNRHTYPSLKISYSNTKDGCCQDPAQF